MNRLDNVLGPENWWPEFVPGERSVLCKLSIRLPDGTVLTKADAGGYAGMADSGDDDKSGYSDAIKRAAVMFGIGRELYGDGVADFVRDAHRGSGGEPDREPAREDRPQRQPAPDPDRGWGNRGAADDRGRPEPSRPQGQAQGQGQQRQYDDRPPTSGKALFAWVRRMEDEHQVGLLKYLNAWSKLQEFPSRMVDFGPEEITLAYNEACKKIKEIQSGAGGDGAAYEEAISN